MAVAARGRTAGRHSESRKESMWGLSFASIWIIGFVVFAAFPMLMAIYIAMTSWNPVSGPFWQAHFIGLDNFGTMIHDHRFWHSIANSIYYALGTVAIMNLVALPMAMLLNQKLKGLNFFRTIFYLPAIMPAVATALIFRLMFLPGTGFTSWVLTKLGIQCDPSTSAACSPLDWLGDPHLTMPVVILMTAWGVGQPLLIFLAGLQGIDASYYEAASIDGANPWQKFRSITFPLLTPAIFFNIVTGLISGFQEFAKLVIYAGGAGSASPGGPSDSLLTTFVYVYQTGFSYDQMGRATAMAFGLFALILIFTALNFWGQRRWVFYTEERS